MAGEDIARDLAIEDPVPESYAGWRLRKARAHGVTERPGEAREGVEPQRQRRFDHRAHTGGEGRRCTAGGNADDDRAAIDDGRHQERRQGRTVDDVDRHADGGRDAGGGAIPRLVTGGDEHQRRARRVTGGQLP